MNSATDHGYSIDGQLPSPTAREQRCIDAFKLVEPASHWKDPINAVVEREQLADVIDAICFYTATPTTVTPCKDGRFQVQSIGYRAGPAGDH